MQDDFIQMAKEYLHYKNNWLTVAVIVDIYSGHERQEGLSVPGSLIHWGSLCPAWVASADPGRFFRFNLNISILDISHMTGMRKPSWFSCSI